MAIVNSNVSQSGLVEKYIGTAYDTVKYVADNMEYVIKVGEIDGIEDIADDIAEAIVIVEEAVVRAETAATNAENSATSASTDADRAEAAASGLSDEADRAEAAADAAEISATSAGGSANIATTKAAEASQSATDANNDAAQTAADRLQTGLDKQQTQQDVATTAANAANASISAGESEAALFTFQGVYLGASAVAPSVDNNGDPLTAGDLYQDTAVTPNLMKFWNGTVWLTAYSATDETNHNSLIGLEADDHLQYAPLTGVRPFTGKVEIPIGSIGNPSLTFTSDLDTGISSGALGEITLQSNGTVITKVIPTGLDVIGDITVSGTVDGVDVSTLATKEEGLGNPSTNLDCLVSLTDGTRSWERRVTESELNNALALKENFLGNPTPGGGDKTLVSTEAGSRSWEKHVTAFSNLDDAPAGDYVDNLGKAVVVATSNTLGFASITASTAVGDAPPDSPNAGALWLNSMDGQIYVFYVSPDNGTQWLKDNAQV